MIPHYLYHYTSVDNLIKIIESKKIRFKRLDLLNDPYEGYIEIDGISGVEKNNAKLIFCSCWNDSSEEDIALWYVYTKVKGVRIKMKAAMFGNDLRLEEHISGYYPLVGIHNIDIGIGTPIKCVRGPIKIQYETDINKLYDKAIGKSVVNTGTENEFIMNDIDLDELGVRKTKHWSYENEWRYKISPFIQIHGSNSVIANPMPYNMPEYVDVPFVCEIEEILLAPQVDKDDVDRIRKYLDENNLNITVVPSNIRTRFNEE